MRVRISYQLSITALFVAVVLAVGLSLVTLSFEQARAITRSAALTFIDRVAEHTAERVDGQFLTVLTTLQVLKRLPSVEMGEIRGNSGLVTTLISLLREHRQLYNLYIGYDDGDFIELDALDRAGPAARAQMEAPANAAFRLSVIVPSPDRTARIQTTTFLASDLSLVSRAEKVADYDPRERPWYKDAFEPGAGAITEPYLFKGASLTGYTVRSTFTAARRGIVAGDILLADADAFLRAQKLGQSGVVFLFDDSGRVVAHPQMSKFVKAHAPDGTAQLPRLDDVEPVDLERPLLAWRGGGDSRQLFEADDGRDFVAAFRTIPTAGSADLRLAVMAPLDEFFADVEASRRRLLLLALIFVGLALPVVWWMGSVLSKSMKGLAAQTDRIQRFEVEEQGPRIRSVVREIDDLGRSVATMSTVVQAFARFVPKRLVQQLVETGTALHLGGARRDVTVLFTDIEGFTNIAELEDPEKVMVQTSRYLAAMSKAITEHGGTVDKFVGDGIMALWNAPADDPDHVQHACEAVLACREANRALNATFASEGWSPYKTRFGLHTGPAVVGNIGSSDRMSYTALGATVNLAARLEVLNKQYGTEILVSEAVREQVSDKFEFRRVDSVKPKGFETPVVVHELRGTVNSSLDC